MKKGLVLEGGAMRGMFTCGVIDVLMENNITFDGLVGVSAGAVFGCNYKSRQIGRGIRYNMNYCNNKEYVSLWSLRHTGDIYGVDFAYRKIPYELDIFDVDTFKNNPMEFYSVSTDMNKGTPIYTKLDNGDEKDILWLRASASMPVVSRPVLIDDLELSDGGTTDSIPLEFLMSKGYNKNVVVLTQPQGYIKKKMKHSFYINHKLKKYPKMVEALKNRPKMYNDQVNFVKEKEKEGSAFVIRPPYDLKIGSICHDKNELKRVYDIGRKTMLENLDNLIKFLND